MAEGSDGKAVEGITGNNPAISEEPSESTGDPPTIIIDSGSMSPTLISSERKQVSRFRATTGDKAAAGGEKPRPVRPPKRHSDIPRHHRQHGYQEYIPAGGMYVVYEKSRMDKKEKIASGSPRSSPDPFDSDQHTHRTDSRMSTTSDTNTFIGEIDGRFSFSEGHVDDYVRVEVNADSNSTSQELMLCKKTVLKPYLMFLKLLGWRRLIKNAKDSSRAQFYTFINILYPSLIFIMLVATIVSQQLSCFTRFSPANLQHNSQSYLVIDCTDHFVSSQMVPGLLILTSFLYGVYIFRIAEPEHMASLMETVFLSFCHQMGPSKKRIINTLRFFLAFGILWIVLDLTLNLMRLGSLQLLDKGVFIKALLIDPNRSFDINSTHTVEEHILRYFFVLFSLVGFLFFDFLYFAVVVAYISQSQLIQYYIESIIHKVRGKTYCLQDAVKDVRQTYTYLQILNSKLATLTALQLFIFLFGVSISVYRLANYPDEPSEYDTASFYLGVIVGIGNIIQWGLLAGAPIVQASRLTSRCRQLRRLGLEVGSRPFIYADTPQLDLHYFLQFTNSTRYTAKLASIPIYPSFVGGLVFLGSIVAVYTIQVHDHFGFFPWF